MNFKVLEHDNFFEVPPILLPPAATSHIAKRPKAQKDTL